MFLAEKPYLLSDDDERERRAGMKEGASEAISRRVTLHRIALRLHGGGADGSGRVVVVVVAHNQAGVVPCDGSGGRDPVHPRSIVSGFVGHGEGQVRSQAGGHRHDAHENVADQTMVALVAPNPPGSLRGDGAPVHAHGMQRVDDGVVLVLRSAVGDDGLRWPPNGKPHEVERRKDDPPPHGGNKASLAPVRVEVRDIQDPGQVRGQLEDVHSNGAVECAGGVGKGVVGAAGEVGMLLAGDASVIDALEVVDVGGREGARGKCPNDDVNTCVAELAVGKAHVGTRLVKGGRGRGGRGRQHEQVAADEAFGGRSRQTGVDGVRGGFHEEAEAFVGVEPNKKGNRVVAEDVYVEQMEVEWTTISGQRDESRGRAAEGRVK